MALSCGMEGCSPKKVYFLMLMTVSYIIGEIAHFLINTSNREVAQDVGFGDLACLLNSTVKLQPNETNPCKKTMNETQCEEIDICSYQYTGLGYEYQVLSGPAFIHVFTIMGIILAVWSETWYDRLSRVWLLAGGTFIFSGAILLMGLATQYWQLFLLRMLIAAGESVCRPTSASLIAELFPPSSRGLATGIFSWGVYYGYGLAFVIGKDLTKADVLGYGWRSSYVLTGIPGILIGFLFLFTTSDPRLNQGSRTEDTEGPPLLEGQESSTTKEQPQRNFKQYIMKLIRSVLSPSMIILLIAAFARHTGGLSWAFNASPYFQNYFPDFNPAIWILCASVFGGSFGVFAGGLFSDRLVNYLGLASRLWLLSVCMLIATPFAVGVLNLEPPHALICLLFYYFFAETWFAVLFTVIVEIVDPEVRSTCVALFLFCMNQVGGNLAVLVTTIRKAFSDEESYRSTLYIMWPGLIGLSAILFLLSSIPLYIREKLSKELDPRPEENGEARN